MHLYFFTVYLNFYCGYFFNFQNKVKILMKNSFMSYGEKSISA